MKKQIVFRVYAERNRKIYWRCFFFKTKADMYEFHKASADICNEKIGKNALNYEALSRNWITVKGDKNLMGHLYFYEGHITSSVVSHECTNSAIYWAKHKNIPFILELVYPNKVKQRKNQRMAGASEERFCHVQGNLVRQVWLGYWNRLKKKK